MRVPASIAPGGRRRRPGIHTFGCARAIRIPAWCPPHAPARGPSSSGRSPLTRRVNGPTAATWTAYHRRLQPHLLDPPSGRDDRGGSIRRHAGRSLDPPSVTEPGDGSLAPRSCQRGLLGRPSGQATSWRTLNAAAYPARAWSGEQRSQPLPCAAQRATRRRRFVSLRLMGGHHAGGPQEQAHRRGVGGRQEPIGEPADTRGRGHPDRHAQHLPPQRRGAGQHRCHHP